LLDGAGWASAAVTIMAANASARPPLRNIVVHRLMGTTLRFFF